MNGDTEATRTFAATELTDRRVNGHFEGMDEEIVGVSGLALRLANANSKSLVELRVENDTTNTLERSKTFDEHNATIVRARTSVPTTIKRQQTDNPAAGPPDYFSPKRRFSLHLPSFKSLGISTSEPALSRQGTLLVLPRNYESVTQSVNLATPNLVAASLGGVLPPLTPPPEDLSTTQLGQPKVTVVSGSNRLVDSQVVQACQDTAQASGGSATRLQGIIMPDALGLANSSRLQKSPWVANAVHTILTALNSEPCRDTVQMVAHTLPAQAKDSRSRPTFEDILEALQADMVVSPYITITHAVPQVRVMEELPKTPPSTPSFRPETHDYFSDDQTIFTHAAVVPIYHSHDRTDARLAGRLVHHVAAPCSIQVSILERYIPPTMPDEVDDFFSISGRSYLADRLSELSTMNGSLILVYPTRQGGQTFARRYIGPIIDPYLRQFVMLKGLTSEAASLMGKMTGVDHMLDFEQMCKKLTTLCGNLTNRLSRGNHRSSFNVTYSETTKVTLDRQTWINWFIEQEQSRLKQNLVEYHQAGGRMPKAEGTREVTVGMLTRDFIDGILKSKEPAGDAEIEVGVFVIARSILS